MESYEDLNSIRKELERLLVLKNYNFLDEQVIVLSQELDKHLNQYHLTEQNIQK